jgi:hypothetical protein
MGQHTKGRARRSAPWQIVATAALMLTAITIVPAALESPGAYAQDEGTTAPVVTGAVATIVTVAVGTPAAGTPVPVDPALAGDPAAPAPATGTDVSGSTVVGADGADGTDGADGAPGQPGQDGQDGQAGADAVVVDSSTDDGQDDNGQDKDKDKDDRKRRDERERKKERDNPPNANGRDKNGNGGVAEVVAPPPAYTQQQAELEQQDGTASTAGAAGQDGTVNGVPRETPESAPVTTGGAPLAPAGVLLPPPVPGLPPVDAQVTDPGTAGGIIGTTELVFNAVADTTVFAAAPDSPQTPESAALLALGGPQGAMSLISFDVSGVGEGTVFGARLTFNGAGDVGAPGGSVGVIYDYIVEDGISANAAPGADTALNVQGVPAWFERVEPGALGAIDVSGSVPGDGAITFVLSGQPDATGVIHAVESGAPAQLILTVGLPA